MQKSSRAVFFLLPAMLLAVGAASTVRADEIADLKKQLAELQAKVEKLEAQQNRTIAEEVNKAVQKKQVTAVPDSLKWAEKVKISGDIRYRHESIDSQTAGKWDQGINRHRLRARVGIDGKVNDEVDLGFRLATGSSDPVSTNQDLEDSFDGKDIWLDRAFFDWHPATMKGFDFVGGKMPNPFYTVGRNELIWDTDLNPEGLAAKYQRTLSDNLKLNLSGGGFWVDEDPSTTNKTDSSLWGIQGYLTHTFENKDYLLGGVSYFDYGNIEGQGDLYTRWAGGSAKWFGNSVRNGVFANDYDIIEVFGEYGFKVAETPMTVFGDYAQNLAASDYDSGWLLGLTFNKCKDPGSWEIGYDYRDIYADAVVGQFNASDFVGGGTDGHGHRFGFTYQLAKNFQTALTYFLNEKKDDYENKYRRLELDLLFKF